jgi:hypothetical protein
MTERLVTEQRVELGSAPVPGSGLAALRAEALSRASFGAGAAHFAPETAVSPWPPDWAGGLCAESLAAPWAPVDAPEILVEVLRRDTASAAIVATGMEAFGDAPWPDAPRGVFAFRHDWAEPLIERLEWQTAVTRLASGNEARQALRRVPRRLLTYAVGHGRAGDALVADWLADHLGQRALWPLPQHAARLTEACPRGAMTLPIDRPGAGFAAAEAQARLRVTPGWPLEVQVEGWSADARALILMPDGWQTARLAHLDGDRLWLAEPLARAAGAGSLVVPLAWGVAHEAAELAQWVPGLGAAHVVAELAAAPPAEADLADPMLAGLPIWPDGNWRDDPSVTAQAAITRQDFSPAEPWARRDDPWPTHVLRRRCLAAGAPAIERWLRRLYRVQGRLGAFWLLDGLASVLRVAHPTSADAGYLRVDGAAASAFWSRPAAALILGPDGRQQAVLTSALHHDGGQAALVLGSGLSEAVAADSRVLRLARCRLDHDAVDLHWHSPELLEIPLAARRLPEPRGSETPFWTTY